MTIKIKKSPINRHKTIRKLIFYYINFKIISFNKGLSIKQVATYPQIKPKIFKVFLESYLHNYQKTAYLCTT